MLGWTALLSVLAVTLCCPAVGETKFTVSVEQDVYQAEENSNITMTWLLHFSISASRDVMVIDLMNVKRRTQIFFYNSDANTEIYPDEFYRERLQCDPQLARKGQFKCLLTDLRLSDSGTYHLTVVLNREKSSKPCDLNVTAAVEKPVGETSKAASRERIGLYASLYVSAVVITALSFYHITLNVCCK